MNAAKPDVGILAGQRLGRRRRRFAGFDELAFFFRQQLEEKFAARFIGLGGQQPPIMVDVEPGDGAVQGELPVYFCATLSDYGPSDKSPDAAFCLWA